MRYIDWPMVGVNALVVASTIGFVALIAWMIWDSYDFRADCERACATNTVELCGRSHAVCNAQTEVREVKP